ncbi:MAG: prepilin-type N-terminal cleavage/methylation domain-containing protein [Candidatus Fermentibacteraceae bacterium]|nr:prepilin-type N-terminal cleavage/methylation domain-containing protein [Candidatus Fermentibacteraceae bacterium]
MFKRQMKPRTRSGMTLIELMVVMGIMGVLFAAVYMFFVKGTEQFHFSRRQNQLATSGKLTLESISDVVLWAGYMPNGGWTEEEWNPVELGTTGSFHFYADFEGDESLDGNDYRQIFRDAYDVVHITDSTGMDRTAGTQIVDLQFNYLDEDGDFLAKPLDDSGREAVRHIVVKITLEDTYRGDVYQTVMQTIITPRNLGVYHNFDPLFYMPPPPDAKIVVNIDGDSTAHAATADQEALMNMLGGWGYSLVDLTDDELGVYDYDSSGVDLIILREMPGSQSHSAISASLQAIRLPMIALDPDDAKDVFSMGNVTAEVVAGECLLYEQVPNHPVHNNLTTPFKVYNPGPSNHVYTLTDLTPGTELITGFISSDTLSGVSVVNQDVDSLRRIHYCAADFSQYSSDGAVFLQNVILWGLPEVGSPPLGDEITMEGFEDGAPGNNAVTMWEDNLEDGVMAPDSIPLYNDFGYASKSMVWVFQSTGSGDISLLADSSLQMHRISTGGYDRNIAAAIVDLSAYNALTDDLYITVNSRAGTLETINSEDGVFVLSRVGTIDTLVSENFETLVSASGDVTFWADNHGRHRLHSPGWNNGTRFVTLDCDKDGNYSKSRMMIEVNTSGVANGTPITVFYRITDHGDETHDFTSSDNRGDYIGWSLGDGITDTVEDHQNLDPESTNNGQWNSYSYTFTPSGTMPSKLYIIFSQYDNYTARNSTTYDGISFDDVTIVADNSTVVMNRAGTPSSSTAWQRIGVDLDDAAVTNSVPFSANFGIALSQYGTGPWAAHGIQWHGFELGVIEQRYSVPGWHHEPVTVGGTDDWLLETISGNHKWTLHANNASQYSDNTDCWLETPSITIPAGTENAVFSFSHSVDLESNYDFGWLEITTDNGATWNFIDTGNYNGSHSSHGAYTGTLGTSVVDVSLDGYSGMTVRLRFVFHSDYSTVRSGWVLDDFEATGMVSGLVVQSIGFKPIDPLGVWDFDYVDLYMGNTSADAFTSDGEWDKNTLSFMGTYSVSPTGGNWVTIDLNDDYLLPASGNLIVKIEMAQTGTYPLSGWYAGYHADMARNEVSNSADPTFLQRSDMRPSFMIGTMNNGQIYVDQDSTAVVGQMPISFDYQFSDFEGIYTLEEFGFSAESNWLSGGDKNDWEIGVPVFVPDIDPYLTQINENRIAGNDLTDDGYYMDDAWNWLRSGVYSMSDFTVYDTLAVAYDRCLRLDWSDYAYIQMAFTTDTLPPSSESDWITVKECHYEDDTWVQDIIPLTYYFGEAESQGKQYFFIRFVLDSGPWSALGGWNIDNVGFYGRNAY